MTSPRPHYAAQGPAPSNYYSSQTPPPAHYNYGTNHAGPSNGYPPYQYLPPAHMPVMHHPQPHSPRMNGRGGGVFHPQNRGGHGYNYHPHQHYVPSSPVPHAHSNPYVQHPKFSQNFTPPYPYHPGPGSYSPSWQAHQPHMMPVNNSFENEHVPNLPETENLSQPMTNVDYATPPAAPSIEPSIQSPAPAPASPVMPQPEPVVDDPPVIEETPPPPIENVPPHSDDPQPSAPSSPAPIPKATISFGSTEAPRWVVWSRRPTYPSNAPGLIFSKNTRPPQHIIEAALPDRTPPASPTLTPVALPAETSASTLAASKEKSQKEEQQFSSSPEATSDTAEDASQSTSTVPSSSVTVATDTPTVPGSPASSSTSISVVHQTVKDDTVLTNEAATPLSSAEASSTTVGPSSSTSTLAVTPAAPASAAALPTSPTVSIPVSTPPAAPAPAAPPVKKSWASLLKPAGGAPSGPGPSSSTPVKNTLPTSSVVGFSIPADAPSQSQTQTSTRPSVSSTKKAALLALLNGEAQAPPLLSPTTTSFAAAASSSTSKSQTQTTTADPSKIRPRGLINTGNMCFANSVLQVLLYCPPFFRLFYELGKMLPESGLDGQVQVPLVKATIELLRDFLPVEEASEKEREKEKEAQAGPSGSRSPNSRGKGKEREMEREEDEWERGSFIPSYVYDAMKEKKRFDNMRGGHQEDAEEFFGFYLETLEEELLAILHAISPPDKGSKSTVEEKEEDAPPEEDGWLEVGKRNRTVVTRTIKSTESPITRIFGGKFRSTLKAPGQKDSATVEDWSSLKLDIQREQINTIQEALSFISHADSVQMSHPTRSGSTIEASKQTLIEGLPPILVLHMKRFLYDVSVGGVVKVGKQVQFGPELVIGSDIMASTTKKPHTTKYKLFGAIYHHGISASGGHYTLDVLHPNRFPSSNASAKPKEGWIRIDDELVSDVRHEDVFGEPEKDDPRCAYLLFYRRVR
ncbi:hypothetical protein D9758_005578 [Tetrapyrgos nigripes]|uniref:ubiquitinyl hydrolase 1 n=1 Tax=Tetrapyrgos nigripes TaxID=182062 RepID=A0A8H5GGQ0_9AGAR|nr:hypothetical protein D9758_005578 [Tetrapyrgos nigripes]